MLDAELTGLSVLATSICLITAIETTGRSFFALLLVTRPSAEPSRLQRLIFNSAMFCKRNLPLLLVVLVEVEELPRFTLSCELWRALIALALPLILVVFLALTTGSEWDLDSAELDSLLDESSSS